jgi:carbon-monoxide dehydrogenase medium subunit
MTVTATAYHRPASLAEACALGRKLGNDAAFLAGGTELVPDYHRGRESARHLITLDHFEELRGIRLEAGDLRIGALTTIAQVAASPLVREWFPVLAEAARAIGSPQVRSRATIGGNFCRAVPCADMPPAAVVAGARVRLASPTDRREIEAEHFFIGPRQTVLEPGEVLVEIMIPTQPRHSGASYQRFARRRGAALAVAAVAARIQILGGKVAGARIALGAVAPVPLLATRAAAVLEGEVPTPELFAIAAAVSAEEALPIDDLRGTVAFRRELVTVLARRALGEAASRAGGPGR